MNCAQYYQKYPNGYAINACLTPFPFATLKKMNFLNFLYPKFNIKLLNLQKNQSVAPARRKLTKIYSSTAYPAKNSTTCIIFL